jgi:hypothetical protein
MREFKVGDIVCWDPEKFQHKEEYDNYKKWGYGKITAVDTFGYGVKIDWSNKDHNNFCTASYLKLYKSEDENIKCRK